MPISETTPDAVVAGATTLSLSQFFSTTASTANPAYVVLTALDRNEYTVTSNGDTGSFTGDGATMDFASTGADGRGAGIVFTWEKAAGEYVNTTYGTLNALTYTASDSANDITNLSLFGTSNLALAQQDASNAYGLMQADAGGYIGSVTIATDPGFSATVPGAATPDGVATAALKFVGDAWNEEGCWVLASTIAAQAGSSLPIQSTAVGVAGKANGEWVVVYNGPAGAGASWQSLVTTGDIIDFVPGNGGGHITTCVSGSGATAMLVDNITYVGSRGQIINAANDGSPSDIIVSAPHPASQEWSGVNAGSVVIYALDTPVITDTQNACNINPGKTVSLSTLFTAKDPAGHAITQYQAYDSLAGDSITLNGKATTGGTVTATSLSALGLLTSGANSSGTDTISVRAFNGTYWGDWQTLSVSLNPAPPVLAVHTANQTWAQGSKVSMILPSTLFTDPQGQAITYSASGAGGANLPSWLNFSAATHSLSGTVPSGLENFAVVITATDTAGLSANETFTVTVPAAAPTLTDKTGAQSWAAGGTIALALPANSFTDPQNETLIYKATLSTGAALPSWLSFSASTLSFTGTAPTTAQTLALKITATDTSGLSATETITAAITKAATGVMLAGDWISGAPASPAAIPPPESNRGGLRDVQHAIWNEMPLLSPHALH